MSYMVGGYPDKYYERMVGKEEIYPLDEKEVIVKDIIVDFETGLVKVVRESVCAVCVCRPVVI